MISLTEFALSDKDKQTQMIIESNTEIEQVNNMNKILMEILKEKDKKIDKAIEYIEERIERVEDISWVEMKTEDYLEEQQEILDILKGEDKE